jgi:hypothetical protein
LDTVVLLEEPPEEVLDVDEDDSASFDRLDEVDDEPTLRRATALGEREEVRLARERDTEGDVGGELSRFVMRLLWPCVPEGGGEIAREDGRDEEPRSDVAGERRRGEGERRRCGDGERRRGEGERRAGERRLGERRAGDRRPGERRRAGDRRPGERRRAGGERR